MWTRETFVDWRGMPSFCPEHVAWLAAILVSAVGLPFAAWGRLSERGARWVAGVVAWVAAAGYFGWLMLAA